MDLDGALKTTIMGISDISVAPAAMGVAYDIKFLIVGKSLKQISGGGAVCICSGLIFNQGMGRTPYDAAFFGEKDISVTTERSVAGPFIAR